MAVDSDIRQIVFWLGHGPGSSISVLLSPRGRGETPKSPTYAPADLVAHLDRLDRERIDEMAVGSALRATVDSARYWQEPDGVDLVAALPEVAAALRGVAEAILSSSTAAEWDGARGVEQWAVDWRVAADASPIPADARMLLAEWDSSQRAEEQRAATERPRDPHANWSGTWWSVPQRILSTRGQSQDALTLVEDSLGWDVATLIPVRGVGRELEIQSSDDWSELCRTYPFEVTASRRHDWFRVTGRDGRWLIPDWPRIAERWDAIHLTTAAYLATASTLVPIDSEYATVIGGWAPDSTLWLNDVAREWEGPRQQWIRPPGNDDWTREI